VLTLLRRVSVGRQYGGSVRHPPVRRRDCKKSRSAAAEQRDHQSVDLPRAASSLRSHRFACRGSR